MNCPVCHIALQMTERQGVEIDYCPQCRGVWLDRGELDKIIDRATGDSPPTAGSVYNQQDRYAERGQEYSYREKKHRKRESFLSELFDFD